MKKLLTLSIACLLGVDAFGQFVDDPSRQSNIDWKEDSTEVVTVDDIVATQERITTNNLKEDHFRQVWGRQSYLNLSYNSSKLSPDQDIPTGLGDMVSEFKSSWGASIQIGRSYRLHKTPISNILQFYLDYTYIDLNINHYDKESGSPLYDSGVKLPNDKFYTPWNLEKYEFNYGMALGPSLSVAPFTFTNSKAAHYLMFNMWFHIGYHVSLLNIKSDSDADANSGNGSKGDYEKMRDDVKLDLGHGLITSFGLSLTWKFVGVGYEHRSAGLKYKSLNKDLYGDDEYKYSASTNRVFLQFKF